MNIYVGNLSYEVEEKDLRKAFGKFGEVVTATVIKDQLTGGSLGFAYVKMGNKGREKDAIRLLENTSLMGRKLMLREMSAQGECFSG